MQIHLLELKSSVGRLSRDFSSHKLHLCLIVLQELKGNYWGADTAFRFFEQAQKKILDNGVHGKKKVNNANSNSGNQTINLIPPMPNSPNMAEIEQMCSIDWNFDPADFTFDPFVLGWMSNGEPYGGFPTATPLQDMNGRENARAEIRQDGLSSNNDRNSGFGINSFLTAEELDRVCLAITQPR